MNGQKFHVPFIWIGEVAVQLRVKWMKILMPKKHKSPLKLSTVAGRPKNSVLCSYLIIWSTKLKMEKFQIVLKF